MLADLSTFEVQTLHWALQPQLQDACLRLLMQQFQWFRHDCWPLFESLLDQTENIYKGWSIYLFRRGAKNMEPEILAAWIRRLHYLQLPTLIVFPKCQGTWNRQEEKLPQLHGRRQLAPPAQIFELRQAMRVSSHLQIVSAIRLVAHHWEAVGR